MAERLTPAELKELTDYKRGAEQLEVLKRLGIRTIIGRNGHPIVTWEAINRALLGQQSDHPVAQSLVPNWSELNR